MQNLISTQTWNLLVASNLSGIGKNTLWQIASDSNFHKTPEEGLASIFPALAEFERGSQKLLAAKDRASAQLESAKQLGVEIIGYSDPDYPALLRLAPNGPALFWYKGSTAALKMPSAAVIGTRQPTEAGIISTNRITTALANAGISIVSGLALGVDTEAHRACVKARKPTIAVLAGGIENIAPRRNIQLTEAILDSGGGLFSEFPIGLPPMPMNFVTRDATQAALSSHVVLIQSDRTGGSLHASRAIVKLRRKLVVTAPIKRDVEKSEPKIEANKLFIDGRMNSILDMGFAKDTLEYVQILRSKDDYPALIKDIFDGWKAAQPVRIHDN